MLKKIILSKYQRSKLNLWLTAKKVMAFYANAWTQPDTKNIPWTFLQWEHHLITYLWDIYEEISMLKSIDEDTTELDKLYNKLQGLRDYAI